jgi:predicted aspartyl protease
LSHRNRIGQPDLSDKSGHSFVSPGAAALVALLLSGCQSGVPDQCKMVHVSDLGLVSRAGSSPLTPSQLNGVTANMLIDSGSVATLVTKATADRLGVPVTYENGYLEGIGGTRELYSFYVKSFRLGELHGERFRLVVSPVDFSRSNPPIDGIIGSNFLSNYDVDFDLQRSRVRLFKPLSGCSNPAVVLPEPLFRADLVPGPGHGGTGPYVRVDVGGKHLLAEVDSGAYSTVIFRNAAHRLGLYAGDLSNDPHFTSRGVGPRIAKAIRHVMTPITVGEITISNLRVGIMDESMTDGTEMLLGMDFLSRVHVWLSFSSHTLIMQYPPAPSPELGK